LPGFQPIILNSFLQSFGHWGGFLRRLVDHFPLPGDSA
jgi:hypothetical protein